MTEKDEAQKLLDLRQQVYGDRVANMDNMGKMCTAYMAGRTEITGEDFTMFMVLYKIYRVGQTPDYGDNIKDVEGYLLMWRELMAAHGTPIVEAENVGEYIRQKLMSEKTEWADPTPVGVVAEGSGNPYANVPDEMENLAEALMPSQTDTFLEAETLRDKARTWGFSIVKDTNSNEYVVVRPGSIVPIRKATPSEVLLWERDFHGFRLL